MKTALKMAALALALTVPALSFAQSSTNGPMTRAQVRNELIQYEKAGYQPSKNQYPADVQAAEARIARANGGADMSAQRCVGSGGSPAVVALRAQSTNSLS